MSFKIIQEINKKKETVLTIIPSAFEENGVYWFPPANWSSKKLNLILKNPFAKPDKPNWIARPCWVKKSDILTLALAEELEECLLNKDVTEIDEADDDSDTSINKLAGRRSGHSYRSPQADFNIILDECLNAGATDSEGFAGEVFQEEPPSSFVLKSISPSTANERTLLENQEKILLKLEAIQEIVTTGMTKLLAQSDDLFKLKSQLLVKESINTVNQAAESFAKILTEVQAKEFEGNLGETEFELEMVRKMSFLVGKSGRRIGQGWTCCYELVDVIFCRHFLTECSWTGASKSADEGKIPFWKFKNILNLFAKVVSEADPEFSLEKTKEFFKKLLRNSTRFESQEVLQTRKSTQRERGPRRQLKKSAHGEQW